ncbi:MAG: hypothetical protein ABUK01_15905 [Leptospirales bacterium]
MAQEVATVKIFPYEQTLPPGSNSVDVNTDPMFGVARIGDKRPTGYRTSITPADTFPNRAPRIPCQFVLVGFDSTGAKISGGDILDGILFNGAKLPNGNTVKVDWSATISNGKWDSYIIPDMRQPAVDLTESCVAGDPPTSALGYFIDDTGQMMPGNDGILQFLTTGPTPQYPEALRSSDFGYTNDFNTDRCGDGFVKADYSEIVTGGGSSNSKPQVQIKSVLTQPDWAVTLYQPKGWNLP